MPPCAKDLSFGLGSYASGYAKDAIPLVSAIAQKYRGIVVTFSTRSGNIITGYKKNCCHDPHISYQEPPNFVEPANTGLNSFGSYHYGIIPSGLSARHYQP